MPGRKVTATALPTTPDGYYLQRLQAGVDGRLLGLFSTFDTWAAALRYRESRAAHPDRLPEPIPRDSEGLICAAIDADWRPLARFAFTSYTYAFDAVGDDLCVVARRRCEAGEENALVFSGAGQARAFHAGDAIKHLQCDGRGGIWAGYMDEGVFGNTVGRHGIVRFALDGTVAAAYNDPQIADCYALNVSRNETWACTYTDFPIVKLDDAFAEQRWTNDVASGVSAIAVAEPYVLLVGGYQDKRGALNLVRLQGGAVCHVATMDAREVLGADIDGTLVAARNDCLFVADPESWRRFPMSYFVELAGG